MSLHSGDAASDLLPVSVASAVTTDEWVVSAHALLRNEGSVPTAVTIVRRRDGRTYHDTVAIGPGDVYGIPAPLGVGPITVEIHAPETMATTSFYPGERPPTFACTERTVVVAHD